MVASKDSSAAWRLIQRTVPRQGAVQDRLAIFGFADLQEGGAQRGLDEVSGGIDLEQPVGFARDLAPTRKLPVGSP